MRKIYLVSFCLLLSSSGWAHARLKSPGPRNASDGIKMGPCGGLPRSANPTMVTGGQLLTVTWEETINHPGKFLISFSNANDAFTANVLKTVVDTQDTQTPTPHQYSAQVQIPNSNCTTCSIQLIQSMEENPAAPSYYYSCADINVVASSVPTPTLPTDTQNTQGVPTPSTSAPIAKFGGAGCGSLGGPTDSSESGTSAMLVILPLLIWMIVRQRRNKIGSSFVSVSDHENFKMLQNFIPHPRGHSLYSNFSGKFTRS